MMLFARGAIAAAALMAAACAHATPPAAESTQADLAAQGQALAQTHCARCHAIGAEAEGAHPMAPPFRTLSQNYPIEALAEGFAEGVVSGHPDMPQFELAPPQIDALVTYLQSVQEPPGR